MHSLSLKLIRIVEFGVLSTKTASDVEHKTAVSEKAKL